jgi:Fe-S cluster assembly scaffold protein SufB
MKSSLYLYLMNRSLTGPTANATTVSGSVEPITKQLPPEVRSRNDHQNRLAEAKSPGP